MLAIINSSIEALFDQTLKDQSLILISKIIHFNMNSKINVPKIAIISKEHLKINGTITSLQSTCEDYSAIVNPRHYPFSIHFLQKCFSFLQKCFYQNN